MNGLRTVHYDELGHADRVLAGEQRPRNLRQLRIERERPHRRNQVGLLLRQHGAHGGKRRFDDRVVAIGLEPVLAQHRPHGDIDGAAGGIDRHHFALEILDLVDWAVGAHVELVRVVAMVAVAEIVGDDADIVHAGVLDCDRQRGIREVADLEFVVGDRRDHRRRAAIAHRLEHVGRAEVAREVFLVQQHGRPVGKRRHPGDAQLQGLGTSGAGCDEEEDPTSQFDHGTHGVLRAATRLQRS
jgi:hypothetical protein